MVSSFMGLMTASIELNQKIFSLTRIKILQSLYYLGPDGATFRELTAGLGIPDGLLFSNLKALEKMGLIGSEKVILEGKELESFYLTEEGYIEWTGSIKWLNELINYRGE